MLTETLKPSLPEPFPKNDRYWTCPKTGLVVPKWLNENLEWRGTLLKKAEKDKGLQRDLIAASAESQLFWINAFAWTYHQFIVDSATGRRKLEEAHVPFITWEIQDKLFDKFTEHLQTGDDILVDKCRDMGASWACVNFIHHQWLFAPDSQILEMSRIKDYVDQTGNMKALFQKHDYINQWIPSWMLPPECLPNQKYRTSMHLHNVINGSTIDGESTTPHAGSGDRRKILLLDEFAKVEHGAKMRSATRDVAFMRIINSTPAGAGTEYSRWKNSGQVTVVQLPFWEHPEKGAGRTVQQDELGGWEITSPWLEHEKLVRSPKELAQEVLMQDIESGDTFFTLHNVYKHKSLFARPPIAQFSIGIKSSISEDEVRNLVKRRDVNSITVKRAGNGPLRWWGPLLAGRPDQSKSYRLGCDIGKGMGASNSVISIKCKETNEKVGEWRDANVPPYDMARVAVAIALWVGGKKPQNLPFIKWEMNGPGWDFGRQFVRKFEYPYYYRQQTKAEKTPKDSKKYGWHSSRDAKIELLSAYDRAIAHGGFINHSEFGLDEMALYVYYPDGGVGPASLIEENASARKTHGDVVIADALTIDEDDRVRPQVNEQATAPYWSPGYRKAQMDKRRKQKTTGFKTQFDFRK